MKKESISSVEIARSGGLPADSPLFQSFLIGGFESACHVNSAGCRLDMLVATQHDALVDEDFARVKDLGVRVVRENVRWHLIDRGGGKHDFTALEPIVEAARRHGIQVIWSLCHYGWPDGLDLFSGEFIRRFEQYAYAAVRYIADRSDLAPLYAPFNEISFVAYAIDRGFMHPYAKGRAHEVKCQLVRATIAGSESVWRADPRARLVHIDPLVNIVPPRDRADLREAAEGATRSQYQAADMISGKAYPELGGHPSYLDVIGLNYYHANQWELPESRLRWEDTPRDERWVPFWRLLQRAEEHYQRPIFISETSHFGSGRVPWFREITDEVCAALGAGVKLNGVCVYPVLDRPDWEDANAWHNSGIWDLVPDGGRFRRVLHEGYAAEIRRMCELTRDHHRTLELSRRRTADLAASAAV